MNVSVEDKQLDEILEIIKNRPQKRRFSDVDLLEVADGVLDLQLRARVPLQVEAIIQMGLSSALYTTRVTRRLMGFGQVKEVYEITGDYDVVVHVEASSVGDLNDFIEELRVSEGVERTATHIVLKNYGKDTD